MNSTNNDVEMNLHIIAAANTTAHCEKEGITEWQYCDKGDVETYTEQAQIFFDAELVRLK